MTSNHIWLRYVILGCFVLLGISGLVVCSATSYFIHQNNKYDYSDNQLENVQGPPGTLLAMGLLTCIFAVYFWIVMDYTYNLQQFIFIGLILIILMAVEASMGIWALIIHEDLNSMLTTSLEESLTVPKISDHAPLINVTIMKLNCCGYNETMLDLETLSSHHCCKFEMMDDITRSVCNDIHGRECKHLKINQCRSVLLWTFLLTLCSVVFQIMIIVSVIFYAKFLRKRKIRHRQSLILAKPSAPYVPSPMCR